MATGTGSKTGAADICTAKVKSKTKLNNKAVIKQTPYAIIPNYSVAIY